MTVQALMTVLLLAGLQENPDATPAQATSLPAPATKKEQAAPALSEQTQPVPAVQAIPPAPPVAPQPVSPEAASAPTSQANPAAPDGQAAPTAGTPAPHSAAGQDAIVVTARRGATPGDPLEQVNQKSFEVTQSVDKAVFGPIAMTYKHTLPNPIRSGIRNVLRNLDQPIAFLNYMLQLKPGRAAKAAGRFVVNSTVGVAGLFDVAKNKPFNLPYKYNGFANTMGYYGIKTGPFLYIPFVGATSLRDAIGDGLDRFVLPLSIGKPFNRVYYFVPATALRQIDRRAELDDRIQELRSGTGNPYVRTRDLYLEARAADIMALHSKRYQELHRKELEAMKPRPKSPPAAPLQAPASDAPKAAEPQPQGAQPVSPQPSPQF